jgi:membrane fusion protein (multidrug efflux system)
MNKTAVVKFSLAALVLAACAAAGYHYWQAAQRLRSTENAYVNADVVQVASVINGPVVAVHVKEGQLVQAGQVLFDVDPEPYKVALAQAQAKLAQAEQGNKQDQTDVSANAAGLRQAQADLGNAQAVAQRTHSLVQQAFLSRQSEDDALAKVKVAEAAVAQAQAKLSGAEVHVARTAGAVTPAVLAARVAVEQAQLDLAHSHVLASKTGWIANLSLVPGTSVVAGMPLFALVAQGSFWVDANFKETELPGIQPGQSAEVEIDMLPGRTYKGVVDVIGNGTGAAFSLLPAQNATGNWVKVTQRVPVRIRLDASELQAPLRVGASAQVSVQVKATPASGTTTVAKASS